MTGPCGDGGPLVVDGSTAALVVTAPVVLSVDGTVVVVGCNDVVGGAAAVVVAVAPVVLAGVGTVVVVVIGNEVVMAGAPP